MSDPNLQFYQPPSNLPELADTAYVDADAPPPGARKYEEYREEKRRNVRLIQLTSGNLVVDVPVPDRVLENAVYRDSEEFTHMRYTACTSDPDDFVKDRYTLRPVLYGRETEIAVVMTMYNEDDELFCRTFHAVMKNIAHLCSRNKSRMWGIDGWKKVCIIVVSDGRAKINKRTLMVLETLGLYQDGVAKNTFNGKPVTAHIYEYTTQISVDPKLNVKGADHGMVPAQIVFCLKEKNAKKINSHRWFFNAFGKVLNPNVCVLLDVGTMPSNTSIYHLWKAFDRQPNVAGACGEICADLGPRWQLLVNPLVATQNFEYKMSNILDKPLESVFGYISVLPGAFSAYRFQALQNISPTEGPLVQYFKGETMHGPNAQGGIFEANMYLAEDRILCFELVAKKNANWVLKYVKTAKAWTDVPDNIGEFISQRRRWLNGSFFAAVYAIWNFPALFKSGHSSVRKFFLSIEFIYNTINMLFSWFSLANFYLAFYFLTSRFADPANPVPDSEDPFGGGGKVWFDIFRQVYVFAIVVQFVLSLGNRPQGSKWIYMMCIILFALVMILMLYITIFSITKQFSDFGSSAANESTVLIISLASTYGLYLVSSILHYDPWHIFTCFIQYLLLLPAFVNILMVYAFCNTHDVSWGTKGDNATASNDLGHAKAAGKDGKVEFEVFTEKEDINAKYDTIVSELKVRPPPTKSKRDANTKKEDYYKEFRTRLVLMWIVSNALLVVIFTSNTFANYVRDNGGAGGFNPYLAFIFWSVAALSAFRFVGCVVYLILMAIWG